MVPHSVLIDEKTIETRVRELADLIAADLPSRQPILLGLLTGSFVFLADLVRQAARDRDITKEASTVWGQYYRVDWAMPSRVDVVLRTIWEIAPGEEIPRLVSVFIR